MDPSCISANADISGIGVRVAIYAQNLLCFMPVVAYLQDGRVSPDEMKGIKDQSIGMLAIAFAILISTIIEATTAVEGQQITSFHAAVILDLSWMNNTSTWIWFVLYAHHLSKADKGKERGTDWKPRCPRCRLEPGRNPILATWSDWAPVVLSKACPRHVRARSGPAMVLHVVDRAWDLFSQAPVLILGSFHLSLMAAVGIWLWLNPVKFGAPILCDPTLTIVGGPAHFSSPALRIFSLTMYFLLLIPGINLLPPILFFLGLHIAYNWSREHHRSSWERWDRCMRSIRRTLGWKRPEPEDGESQKVHTPFLVVGLVLLVVINIIFLVDIELTLSRNKHLQSDEDNLWGFGQVLALLLLVMPLRDAWNALRDIQEALRGVQQQFHQALREEIAATPIKERLHDLITEGANPKEPMKNTGFGNSLQLAAYHGQTDLVKFLLSEEILGSKRVIETEPSGGYGTALQAASANGQKDVVQLLLNHSTDKKKYLNIVGGHYGTALCAACANDDVEMAQLLVEEGARPELSGELVGTPLHVASLMGSMEIIRWLVGILKDRHANLNNEWKTFGTALDVAWILGNREVEEHLRESGFKGVVYVSHTAPPLCVFC
ncbi:ankyrin repeat-containing domain protein [Mycena latifolia]|nr:ankyrin repeat-containing domain protein [Mycena latifolia]